MKVYVPPGIGDISWIYSKLGHLPDLEFVIQDSDPRRSSDFVDLLPGVKNLGYEKVPHTTRLPGVDDPPRDGEFAILNHFLETGHTLARVWPELPTNYHYQLNTTDADRAQAEAVLDGKPAFGIYCSSRKHRADMKFWDTDDWCRFMDKIGGRFVVIGAEYDDRSAEVAKLTGAIDTVGKLKIGATIELIRRLDYFFAFPSGLGILADVVKTPCTMWYWGGNRFMMNGRGQYQDPARNDHVVRPYGTVDNEVQAWRRLKYRIEPSSS